VKARPLLALSCALGTLVVTASPAVAVEPVVVVNTESEERAPAASTTFLAWQVLSPRFNSNVRAQAIGDDTSFRVNPKGTQAFTGGIDGSMLLYGQAVPGEDSDLVLVDLATQTELELPDGVNSNAEEFSPSISGSHLLFGRFGRLGEKVMLFDTMTLVSEVVYTKQDTDRRDFTIIPTQVNGNYAVWQQLVFSNRTGAVSADVFLYDIPAATTTKISSPDADRPSLYGPAVDVAGTVYFGRSNFACGENAQLIGRDLDGTETVLYEFPANRDFFYANAVSNPDDTTDVYFDRGSCRGQDAGNIWKLSGV
jgi:hypothetical protein